MTCNDCINCDSCPTGLACCANPICKMFKDKSEWLHLPCKVGDKIWYPHPSKDKVFFQIVSKKNIYSIAIRGKIGKSVFLTREEAKKALAERKGQ